MHLCLSIIVFTLTIAHCVADFRSRALQLHNEFRQRHGAAPLQLDDGLNAGAQNWAETIAASLSMDHSQSGENLFATGGNTDVDAAAEDAVRVWYGEVTNYDYANPGFSMATGHFTQVVWKNSQRLGIGAAIGRDGNSVYVVAHYDPPGNYPGQFPENVLPGGPTGGHNFNWNDVGDDVGTRWAHDCDYPFNDLEQKYVKGEECGNQCAANPECNHFAWSPESGGKCWLKRAGKSDDDATPMDHGRQYVCGRLTRRQ